MNQRRVGKLWQGLVEAMMRDEVGHLRSGGISLILIPLVGLCHAVAPMGRWVVPIVRQTKTKRFESPCGHDAMVNDAQRRGGSCACMCVSPVLTFPSFSFSPFVLKSLSFFFTCPHRLPHLEARWESTDLIVEAICRVVD